MLKVSNLLPAGALAAGAIYNEVHTSSVRDSPDFKSVENIAANSIDGSYRNEASEALSRATSRDGVGNAALGLTALAGAVSVGAVLGGNKQLMKAGFGLAVAAAATNLLGAVRSDSAVKDLRNFRLSNYPPELGGGGDLGSYEAASSLENFVRSTMVSPYDADAVLNNVRRLANAPADAQPSSLLYADAVNAADRNNDYVLTSDEWTLLMGRP